MAQLIGENNNFHLCQLYEGAEVRAADSRFGYYRFVSMRTWGRFSGPIRCLWERQNREKLV